MNRLESTFRQLKQDGRKAVISYIVNGDPRPEATLPALQSLVSNGADIIELGIPFSDPMAEGPTIQRGHERALAYNVSLKNSLELVSEFRKTNDHTPIVLMGYANPIERMGYDSFAAQANLAGVDGVLTVDLPPEESEQLNAELKTVNISMIFLVAPTTSDQRIQHIVNRATGFIYYVSLKGVTGAGHIDIDAVSTKVKQLKGVTSLPVCVGFGIKDADSAKAVSSVSDGVVVGSALVDIMGNMQNAEESIIANMVGELIGTIRQGVDSN